MPTITAPDGETWHLSAEQREALSDLLSMPPDHFRALRDLAEQQIAIEAIPMPSPGVTLPIFTEDGDAVIPMRCYRRKAARLAGQDLPRCAWKEDKAAGGFRCWCGGWLPPDSDRARLVAVMMAMKDGGDHE